MASFQVWLGIFLIGGFLLFGIFTSVTYENTPTGAVLAEAAVQPKIVEEVQNGPSQQEINICMNGCMRECVVDVSDNDPCLPVCEGFCKVQN